MRKLPIIFVVLTLLASGLFYTAKSQANPQLKTVENMEIDPGMADSTIITPDMFSDEPVYKDYEYENMPSSGIRGVATLGPMCPVIRDDVDCPDAPYMASINIWDDKKNFIKTITAEADGGFEITLSPGSYVVEPKSPNVLPRSEPRVVLVSNGKFTEIEVKYDSGIR